MISNSVVVERRRLSLLIPKPTQKCKQFYPPAVSTIRFAGASFKVRLHRNQNRHNTANQHLCEYTLQERVATFKPTAVLSIATTLEFYARCSNYLARLSARNRLTLLAPDSRGR
jgi:hypothetical protein